MPSSSKQQQKFFGVVKSMQQGDTPKKGKAGKAAKSMSKDDVDDFASTKHKGLPKKVKREMKVRELIKRLVREIMSEGKLSEDFKNNEWEVYVADENRKEKIVKVAKSKRAAVILYNKLIKTDKYHEVGMRVIKEEKLTEAKETIFDVAAKVMKDKQHQNYKSKKGKVMVDMQSANLLTQVSKKAKPQVIKFLSDLGHKNPNQLMRTLWAIVK